MDDRQIVDMLWKRLEQAIDALSAKYGLRLQRTAMNILEDPQDAEEAVNDTYLALWNAIPPAKPEPLGAFVCRVGKNTALKRLRSRTAQRRDSRYDLSLDELAQCLPGSSLEDALDARTLGQAIDRFLDTLTHQNRVLFLRRYWFGDSLKDAAAHLHLSESAATVRLHRIRNQLKAHLIKEGFYYEPQETHRSPE